MKMSYFPGCTLKNTAKELDIYTRRALKALDVTLEEVEDFQCCGGVFTSAKDEVVTKLASVRVLKSARDKKQPLVTVCSACHNVVKQTNHAMRTDSAFADTVNRFLADGREYRGETEVFHVLELLRDVIGFDTLREKVRNPLSGKKIAAYYGCLLLRPHAVLKLDDPENPRVMEDMLLCIGAEPVLFANRNECCGGYVLLENAALAKKRSREIIENAKAQGAEMLVTACPLCKYNLEKAGSELPVIYFTELLAEAFGVKEADANA